MPLVPLRGLGDYGILADPNANSLPPNAWSEGNNVRFDSGKVLRSPVFRTLISQSNLTSPVFMLPVTPTWDTDFVLMGDREWSFYKVSGTSESSMTNPGSWTTTASTNPFTGCILGDVAYVNNKSNQPVFHASSSPSNTFETLTDWTSTHRCGALRAYKDFLIAMDVTKGSTEYPSMVKWSGAASTGAPPSSWDNTDPSEFAGENILADMDSRIIDGLSLQNAFMIYGTNQVWRMDFIGGRNVFSFRKLFGDVGIINQNCVIEVEGYHYVFGQYDIYRHDGTSWNSLAYGRIKDKVFKEIKRDEDYKFHVFHNPFTSSIYFCYIADDAQANFFNTPECNRAAVYNYRSDTWGFEDLPSVGGSALLTFDLAGGTWDDQSASWQDIGGTWQSFGDEGVRLLLLPQSQDASNSLTYGRVLVHDLLAEGSTVALDQNNEATKGAYVVRTGLDLDIIAGLGDHKSLRRFWPQARCFNSVALDFQIGGALYPEATPTYGSTLSFDPTTNYKLDTRQSGRYLAVRLDTGVTCDFELTAYDLDIAITGRR